MPGRCYYSHFTDRETETHSFIHDDYIRCNLLKDFFLYARFFVPREGGDLLKATHQEVAEPSLKLTVDTFNIHFMASRIRQKWPQDHSFLTLAESHLDPP